MRSTPISTEQGVDALGDGDAATDPSDRGDHAHGQSLTQNRTPDLLRVGADGAQQRELAAPLPQHDGEGVVDDEDRHEQCDSTESQQDVADDVDLLGEPGGRLGEHRRVVDDLCRRHRCGDRGLNVGHVGPVGDLHGRRC